MRKVVIDASICIAFSVGESNRFFKESKAIIEQIEQKKIAAFAPELLKVEFCNGLRFASLDEEDFTFLTKTFFALPILYPTLEVFHYIEAERRAVDANGTVYDALYHVLADSLDATFLTCDKKYYEKAKEWGSIELVG